MAIVMYKLCINFANFIVKTAFHDPLGLKYGYVGTLGRSMLVYTPAVVGVIRSGCKIPGILLNIKITLHSFL